MKFVGSLCDWLVVEWYAQDYILSRSKLEMWNCPFGTCGWRHSIMVHRPRLDWHKHPTTTSSCMWLLH